MRARGLEAVARSSLFEGLLGARLRAGPVSELVGASVFERGQRVRTRARPRGPEAASTSAGVRSGTGRIPHRHSRGQSLAAHGTSSSEGAGQDLPCGPDWRKTSVGFGAAPSRPPHRAVIAEAGLPAWRRQDAAPPATRRRAAPPAARARRPGHPAAGADPARATARPSAPSSQRRSSAVSMPESSAEKALSAASNRWWPSSNT